MRNTNTTVLAATVAWVVVSGMMACVPLYVYAQHEEHHSGGVTTKDPNMAPASQQTMMQGMMQDVRELRAAKGEDRERTYLTLMMDHHQSGIDMARLALQKAQRPAVKREARQIITEQTNEIEQMRAHLTSAHTINRTAKPDPRMQPTIEKLQGLSGVEFDQAFAREMSVHHQGAIDMSMVIVEGGVPHRQIRTLAQKIIRGNRKSQQNLKKAIS